ncbi:Flp/Fap pilin component [compost metagenome]|jgi:pilus assembly protein Flp/PilA
MELIAKLIREEEGQSMVEYGLIVAVVALVCAGTYKVLGEKINGMIEKLGKSVDAMSKNIK